MRTFKTLCLAALATAGFTASAANYTMTHLDGPFEFQYLDEGESYHNSFNLGLGGGEMVTWAKLSFAFADDALLGDAYWDLFGNRIWLGDPKEWALLDIGYTIDSEEVDGSALAYEWVTFTGLGLVDWLNTSGGLIDYSVLADEGDFYLKEVVLCAKTEIREVPDTGATAFFLGLGLLGLAARRRRS